MQLEEQRIQQRILQGRSSMFFVRSMSLCFCTRSESDTRNAVTSHDCYTVSRECPFVCKRTSFSHAFCLSISETLFAVQSFICFFQSLCYFVIFRDYPCREVALDRIYKVCIDGRLYSYMDTVTSSPYFCTSWKEHGSHPGSFPMFRLLSYDGQEIQSRSQLLHSGLGM